MKIQQKEALDYIINDLGSKQWTPVYLSHKKDDVDLAFYSALVPLKNVDRYLESTGWELLKGDGLPGCSQSFANGETQTTYHRYGNGSGIEPLVVLRQFEDIKPSYLEVSEEFRHFHDLYYDSIKNCHIKILSNGDEEEVVRISRYKVEIQTVYIRQYLAIKEMALLIYFDHYVRASQTLAELGLTEVRENRPSKDVSCYFSLCNFTPSLDASVKSLSRLIGKKVIRGYAKEESGFWPYDRKENYCDFIIKQDSNGTPVLSTCNPKELDNNFNANPGSPHYLTPVFFKKDVLTRYYGNTDKFSVEDGYLRCQSLWGLRIDNDHKEYVVVFLGDLGRDLPEGERTYWKAFNISPAGGISETNFKRSFLAEFTNAKKSDLAFQYEYEEFCQDWLKEYGWELFKPLAEKDKHHLRSLRIPLNDSQGEFDSQVQNLAKILIDSLNEKTLSSEISKVPENAKGMTKLELYLEEKGFGKNTTQIKYLRNLWDLRMGLAHRKGDSYEKAETFFELTVKGYIDGYIGILEMARGFLRDLRAYFLNL